MTQEDVWEWPVCLFHGQIYLDNLFSDELTAQGAFNVISQVISAATLMRYSLGVQTVKQVEDWLVSTGEGETVGAPCTLRTYPVP